MASSGSEKSALEQLQSTTNIDRRQCHRTVPVRVISFGLSRTGTLSLRQALKILGYNDTYHYSSCSLENPRDCGMWIDAFKAKFEGQGTFGKEQWDQLLGHCMAITDSPSVFFYPELLEAYPDARIILTTRDLDDYYNSFMKTLWPFGMRFSIPTWNPVRLVYRALLSPSPFNDMNKYLYKYGHGVDFDKTGKQRYLRHNDAVRRAVPKKNLLEFNVKEGWEPLCKFLEKPVPDMSFPNANEADAFNEKWAPVMRMLDGMVAAKLAGIVSVLAIGLALYQRR